MCGIVGYNGARDPKEVLFGGLKTLEYRGYDSAGVSILDRGKFRRLRAEGKLAELEKKLEGESFDGHLGIGHTRWATHGVPNEVNAHPHYVDGVSIVHNGIIENYLEIREELKAEGIQVSSETDSELVAHLLAREVSQGASLSEAVLRVIPRLQGAYAVLAVSEKEPDTIVAFKYGPPLILGVGDKEMFVTSDVQAIVPYTRKAIHLVDHQVAEVHRDKYRVFDVEGKDSPAKITEIDWDTSQTEKHGFEHFMLKEIFEQPRAVAAALAPHIDLEKMSVQFAEGSFQFSKNEQAEEFRRVERIFIVACGTSYYAGMAGEYMVENLAKVPVEIDFASEFRYRNPVIPKNSLVIVISQSGETADTLAVLRQVKELGAATISICNVKGSTIDREADGHLYINAGAEIGVASTKAFVATLALLNLFAVYLARVREQISEEKEQTCLKNLLAVPSQMESVLAYDEFFAEAASTLKQYSGFLYLGRGINFPISLEGALKLKELAYMHAEGYAAGEMKHGPLALIDQKMAVVVIAPQDDVYEKTVSNLEEARARGGQIISIGTVKDEKLQSLSKHFLSLPKSDWLCSPLLSVIPVQLLAYHVAKAKGHDVDQPRNLAKSVTVE